MARQLLGHVNLTFKASREGGQWASECLELGTASCGDTVEESFDALADATEVYLQTLDDEGERDRVFALRGIMIVPGPPDTEHAHTEIISVPTLPHEVVSRHELAIPVGAA